jgi:hypothetical protein
MRDLVEREQAVYFALGAGRNVLDRGPRPTDALRERWRGAGRRACRPHEQRPCASPHYGTMAAVDVPCVKFVVAVAAQAGPACLERR